MESHLLQMRGLKPKGATWSVLVRWVASFTDAWIETFRSLFISDKPVSHLLQMRGLKRDRQPILHLRSGSHLLQMRGLKLFAATNAACRKGRIFYRCVDWNCQDTGTAIIHGVASFTDAWIETRLPTWRNCWSWVASFTDAWIETLMIRWNLSAAMSHLLQMRGLKHTREADRHRRC